MCGIVGCIRIPSLDAAAFVKLRDRLTHRGPDDAGFWQSADDIVLLGHRRLSILDLSAFGHQPMISTCGRFVMVFNGEVYNYLELRADLETLGHGFKGHGDTEVVLAGFRQWGEACLNRFNGMFAIAIWDRGTADTPPSLFLARDRAGKKPLYYAHRGQRLAFASELKAIPREMRDGLNIQALNHYLALGFVPGALCIEKGVNKLPPAHAARFRPDTGELKVWRWWALPVATHNKTRLTGEDFAEQAWQLLTDAVKLRMRSDVPVGVFLSGGLDSSLVTAAAAVSGQPVETFTIGLPGSKLDESHHARAIADHFSTRHHQLDLPRPSLDVLDELAAYIDEPLADSSILPTYLVSKLTAQHVKVALGGDGGDELYGGYAHYQAALRDQHRLGWLPEWSLQWLAGAAAKLPAGVWGRNRLASLRGGVAQSHVWGTSYFDIDLRRRILHPDAINALGGALGAPEALLLGLSQQGRDIVDALTRTDFQVILPDDYMVKVDRASMANSLEVRTPFLDYRLMEHAFGTIPSDWKTTRDERRRVQNLMARQHLPKDYQLGRKQGFSIPMDEWLRQSDFDARLEDLPDSILNRNELLGLVRGLAKGRANGARLFGLIMLAISQNSLA